MNFGASAQSVGTMASKIMDYEIKSDADIAQLAMLMRDFAQACGAVIDTGGDQIYTALFMYDRQRKRFGKTRAERVVRPIRHFASGMRFAHRFMMRAVLTYRKEYAEDINEANASKKKAAFQPGGQAAA
jgi:hypothetical protein